VSWTVLTETMCGCRACVGRAGRAQLLRNAERFSSEDLAENYAAAVASDRTTIMILAPRDVAQGPGPRRRKGR